MESKHFSTLEVDAIGEILNISLGSSATALSTMLSARVDISTPVVRVVEKDQFEMEGLEPAVGVEITYVSGLSGNNVMILKRQDVKIIVEMLMGMEMPDEEFELNEMNISAICEVMNQMMGASSTALSEFLDELVNISTPVSFEVDNVETIKDKYFVEENEMVCVSFTLQIGERLESEFMNLMPVALARRLVSGFFPDAGAGSAAAAPEPTMTVDEETEEAPASTGGRSLTQEEIEAMLAGGVKEEPIINTPVMDAPAVEQQEEITAAATIPAPTMTEPQQEMPIGMTSTADASVAQMQQMMTQMQQMMMTQMQQMAQVTAAPAAPAQPKQPKTINTKPLPVSPLNDDVASYEEQEDNLEMIMGVPLEVSVEIGRTQKMVRDILSFTKGTLVVLDKVAGEQVDLFVNGRCIAKGDVVVVEDNFGIRITEIIVDNVEAE